ncbi:hypothetical protein [Peptostreptococcus sp. D1]|uniref:hypothetical protein n=1 Tax=Peptostreptococcus sp. D1 TaxID=72304 RepID=UPI0008E01581|nr:hypothetical protein [Peptostreptococcus sp. D1]SFE22486.1 hypothetical protein SAMN02910278_00321 [Peptostreptococcus sp. D1]
MDFLTKIHLIKENAFDRLKYILCMRNKAVDENINRKFSKITLKFNRYLRQESHEIKENDGLEVFPCIYSEQLEISSKKGTIEIKQHFDDELECVKIYYMPEAVEMLFEYYRTIGVFSDFYELKEPIIKENNNDFIEAVIDEYILVLEYCKSKKIEVRGSFDLSGLPRNYSEFVNPLLDFLEFFNITEMFNSHLYLNKRTK